MRTSVALLLLLAACDRPPSAPAPQVEGPFRLGERVAWIDRTHGRAHLLDPTVTPPKTQVAKLPPGATFIGQTKARDALFVLTPGREARRRDDKPEAPALTVVRPSAEGLDASRVYPLAAPFDRVAIGADGRAAVAYFSEGASSDAYFRNPNELALIDLSAPAGDQNPIFRTIRSLGASPAGVLISPPLKLAGRERSILVVVARGYLTLLDLDRRDRPEITVPLGSPESAAKIVPEEVVFDPPTATLFVRAQGTADLFALTLEARPGATPAQNDFSLRINQPSTGKSALGLSLIDDGERRILLTANASQDLTMVDTVTGEFATLRVGVPIDTVLLMPPEAPRLAVLWNRRSPRAEVHLLAIPNLSTRFERALERRTLARAARDLIPVPGGTQLLVVHDDARTVISVLDLGARRTDTPILGRIPLGSFDFTSGGFLVGVSTGLARLGALDLANLHPSDLRLDHDPKRVVAVGDRLVIDHGAAEGLVTVVPRPTATREEARVVWGFFAQGVFDRRQGE